MTIQYLPAGTPRSLNVCHQRCPSLPIYSAKRNGNQSGGQKSSAKAITMRACSQVEDGSVGMGPGPGKGGAYVLYYRTGNNTPYCRECWYCCLIRCISQWM